MVAATAKRSNDRVLKACHRAFIKLHEIGYLGLIRLETRGNPDDKKQNSGQNRKAFDKNVLRHWKRHLGAEEINLENGSALSRSGQLKRVKARAKIQRHVSLF